MNEEKKRNKKKKTPFPFIEKMLNLRAFISKLAAQHNKQKKKSFRRRFKLQYSIFCFVSFIGEQFGVSLREGIKRERKRRSCRLFSAVLCALKFLTLSCACHSFYMCFSGDSPHFFSLLKLLYIQEIRQQEEERGLKRKREALYLHSEIP